MRCLFSFCIGAQEESLKDSPFLAELLNSECEDAETLASGANSRRGRLLTYDGDDSINSTSWGQSSFDDVTTISTPHIAQSKSTDIVNDKENDLVAFHLLHHQHSTLSAASRIHMVQIGKNKELRPRARSVPDVRTTRKASKRVSFNSEDHLLYERTAKKGFDNPKDLLRTAENRSLALIMSDTRIQLPSKKNESPLSPAYLERSCV